MLNHTELLQATLWIQPEIPVGEMTVAVNEEQMPVRLGLGIEEPGTFWGGDRSRNSKSITATQWAPDYHG
ncbi:MAG: hypothetical protein PHH90_08640 [Limnochordia bacterium]|nr:hypothetical protein [Limnochordia bacterium]